jgi:phosphopantothenoylcysteine decarboxylase/phosphopantothenate--cysteine ligase
VRLLITAGPTREPLDPVRYLSNRSSGKMGYAMAEAALEGGHEVILISGPAHLAPPPLATLIRVATSDEMFDAVHRSVSNCDIVVMCAAVTDYKPAVVEKQKIKKGVTDLSLTLIPTRDILASLGQMTRSYLLVGFAAETTGLERNARTKLQRKNSDIIVANDVAQVDSGMESDENEVIIFFRDGHSQRIARAQKKIVARALIKIFVQTREKCLTKKA